MSCGCKELTSKQWQKMFGQNREKLLCHLQKKNLEGFFISFSQVSVGLNKHTIQRHHPEFAEI